MKSMLTIIYAILVMAGSAQDNIRSVVFFDLGRSELTPSAQWQIDSITEAIRDKNYQITLAGHADTTGNRNLNLELSEKRALNVMNHLISRGISQANIRSYHFGEDNPVFPNTTDDIRIKNRCVVIDVRIVNEDTAVSEVNDVSEKAYVAPFERDTVIRGPKGTMIEIRAGTFYPQKISDINFEIREIFTACDMLKNNVFTRTIGGDCLTSAGMIFVRPTVAGVEVQPNKGQLVTIKIPAAGEVDKEMKLYGGVKDKNGTIVWKDLAPEVSYQEQGHQFYVFKVDTLSSFNLDKPVGVTCKKDGHKIKIPPFTDGIISQTYPDEIYLSVAERNTKRIFTLDKTVKDKNPLISVVGLYKDGNPYLAKVPLYDLRYNKRRDMYIVDEKYFRRIFKVYNSAMTPADYLCDFEYFR